MSKLSKEQRKDTNKVAILKKLCGNNAAFEKSEQSGDLQQSIGQAFKAAQSFRVWVRERTTERERGEDRDVWACGETLFKKIEEQKLAYEHVQDIVEQESAFGVASKTPTKKLAQAAVVNVAQEEKVVDVEEKEVVIFDWGSLETKVQKLTALDGFPFEEIDAFKKLNRFIDGNPRRFKRIQNIFQLARTLFKVFDKATPEEKKDMAHFFESKKRVFGDDHSRFLLALLVWIIMNEQWAFRTCLIAQLLKDDAQLAGGTESLYAESTEGEKNKTGTEVTSAKYMKTEDMAEKNATVCTFYFATVEQYVYDLENVLSTDSRSGPGPGLESESKTAPTAPTASSHTEEAMKNYVQMTDLDFDPEIFDALLYFDLGKQQRIGEGSLQLRELDFLAEHFGYCQNHAVKRNVEKLCGFRGQYNNAAKRYQRKEWQNKDSGTKKKTPHFGFPSDPQTETAQGF